MWDEIFGKPFNSSGADLNVSARAAVAVRPADAEDAQVLLSCAEAALRRATETGETDVSHSPEMAARSAERRTPETRLRRPLEREALVLHDQPKLELQSRHILGV